MDHGSFSFNLGFSSPIYQELLLFISVLQLLQFKKKLRTGTLTDIKIKTTIPLPLSKRFFLLLPRRPLYPQGQSSRPRDDKEHLCLLFVSSELRRRGRPVGCPPLTTSPCVIVFPFGIAFTIANTLALNFLHNWTKGFCRAAPANVQRFVKTLSLFLRQ